MRLAAALGVLLLAGCVAVSPPPTPSSTIVPGVTRSVTPSGATLQSSLQPPPTESAGDWQLVQTDEPTGASALEDVIAVADGFLSAGAAGPVAQEPVILHSADGVSWTPEILASRQTTPSRLALVRDRVVAVGGGQSARCGHPSVLDTWTRDRSGTWTEAPFDQAFCFGTGTSSLLAVHDQMILIGVGSGDVVYRLASDDGLHWTDETGFLADVYPHAALTDGTRVWVFGSTPDGQPVVLLSADGRTFGAPERIVGLGPDAAIVGAAMLDGRPVAIAARGTSVGVAHLLDTGGWDVVGASGIAGDAISRIEAVDGHLVALGGDETGTALIWTSADGSAWRLVRVPGAAVGTTLTGVAVHDGTAVMVGQVESAARSALVGGIWTGPAALLAP